MQYPKDANPPPFRQKWKRNTAKHGNGTQPNMEAKYGQMWKQRK